jgi:hypothetical protein
MGEIFPVGRQKPLVGLQIEPLIAFPYICLGRIIS